MPELPEAETIARGLHRSLAGRTLGRVLTVRPDIVHHAPRPLDELLPGRLVVRVHRVAKRVVLDLEPAARMVVRLGMSGRLLVCPAETDVEPHTHLRVAVQDTTDELRFRDPRRFGGLWWNEGLSDDETDASEHVGPDPLTMTLPQFRQIILRHRQIKALLMDQRAIAGLGNIYCDESLYAAGIHPLTPARDLDDQRTKRLFEAIRTVLRRAIRFNGTTLLDYRGADGREGSFRGKLRVYQRAGASCYKCSSPIQRITAAGRSTFFCPHCQAKLRRRRALPQRRHSA